MLCSRQEILNMEERTDQTRHARGHLFLDDIINFGDPGWQTSPILMPTKPAAQCTLPLKPPVGRGQRRITRRAHRLCCRSRSLALAAGYSGLVLVAQWATALPR